MATNVLLVVEETLSAKVLAERTIHVVLRIQLGRLGIFFGPGKILILTPG
jgi:hypothetical protein